RRPELPHLTRLPPEVLLVQRRPLGEPRDPLLERYARTTDRGRFLAIVLGLRFRAPAPCRKCWRRQHRPHRGLRVPPLLAGVPADIREGLDLGTGRIRREADYGDRCIRLIPLDDHVPDDIQHPVRVSSMELPDGHPVLTEI